MSNQKILSDDELHELYSNWWNNRSPEEYELHATILDYECALFEDMTFQEGSLCWEITDFLFEEFDSVCLGLEPFMCRFI